jgi:hypothetical protein
VLNQPTAITTFLDDLSDDFPRLACEISAPEQVDGYWFLDFEDKKQNTITIMYKDGFGFGFFSGEEGAFETRPNHVEKELAGAVRFFTSRYYHYF